MRYLVAAVSIVLLLAIAWVAFFSGIILKKTNAPVAAPSSISPASGESVVILETTFGRIKIALDKVAAPQTAANFAKLAGEGFYDGLTFHRIIPGFVIQGGDPKGDGTGGPGYTLPAEIKLLHRRGAVAMARLSDQVNPQRESSGSQFYIALQDLPQLDGQYTVFGEVGEGMEIVDQIAQVPKDAFDKPLEPVIIQKATLINE